MSEPTRDLPAPLDPAAATAAAGDQADLYVLQGATNTTTKKIALKRGDAFMVSDVRGDLPLNEQEAGLFWHGACFLRSCDLFLAGRPLMPLSHSVADEGDACQIDLCNSYFTLDDETALPQGTIHVRRLLELHNQRLVQTLILTSFHPTPVRLLLGLRAGANFKDIFEVRGMTRPAVGVAEPAHVERDAVWFVYHGRDEVRRETRLSFTPPADIANERGAFWDMRLQPNKPMRIHIHIHMTEEEEVPHPGVRRVHATEAPEFPQPAPEVQTDNVFFNRLLKRSIADLQMMTAQTPQGLYPYGGIPWYVCPFGRDGLITSLEFLPWFPEIARGTLNFLAHYQGAKVDPFTEEEPGKILHEFRQGEMANCREIPFIPYYGTVDATPLFLITLEQYIRWTDDSAFLAAMWPHARMAARWMMDYGDIDGDSFLEYRRVKETGLWNQGWKDSWDAISHADGRLADPPIALCEVQGYAYAAYRAMVFLAERMRAPEEAELWGRAATTLQANFLRHFWWEDEHALYLALDGHKQPCKIVSSNAGQCLWSGIIPPELAGGLVTRMLADDMYSEWGIRTLSARAARYNPMSYHNGSVWPHDTAMVGAGFARYGHKLEAGALLGNLFGVSLHYDHARLPELFCGFGRHRGYGPTAYPVACAPQSWAAGAPFLLLSSVLGFHPEADQKRLILHYPTLPDWLTDVEVRGIRLGQCRANLRFMRSAKGTAVTLTEDCEIELHILAR